VNDKDVVSVLKGPLRGNPDEISKLTGISVETVKTILNRQRRTNISSIQQDGGPAVLKALLDQEEELFNLQQVAQTMLEATAKPTLIKEINSIIKNRAHIIIEIAKYVKTAGVGDVKPDKRVDDVEF